MMESFFRGANYTPVYSFLYLLLSIQNAYFKTR